MNPHRGKLIFGPCGVGKSFFLAGRDKTLSNSIIEDGDILLEKAEIKNRNYYWYNDSYSDNRETIIAIFDEYLNMGINILYSGNPLVYEPDIIIMIDKNTRWKRLRKRKSEGDFCPTRSDFEKEENAYLIAMEKGIIDVNSFQDLETILFHKNITTD